MTRTLLVTGASAGIGFAVPVDTVSRLVPQLIARGKVEQPGLGATFVPQPDAFRAKASANRAIRSPPTSRPIVLAPITNVYCITPSTPVSPLK